METLALLTGVQTPQAKRRLVDPPLTGLCPGYVTSGDPKGQNVDWA